MKSKAPTLSELEGTVLADIGQTGETTAHAVRKRFAASLSSTLSASKGAVYPAIARLIGGGFIAASAIAGDRRGTQILRLTARGRKAMQAWICDADAAAGAGLDPFRARAGHWADLPGTERAALCAALEKAIRERLAMLKEQLTKAPDLAFAVRIELEIRQQKSRLAFLKDMKNR